MSIAEGLLWAAAIVVFGPTVLGLVILLVVAVVTFVVTLFTGKAPSVKVSVPLVPSYLRKRGRR